MSTTTHKRHLAKAEADAEALRELFEGTYQEWHVAGSVRRRQPHVGDVEHVVIPRFGELEDTGSLFAGRQTVNLVLQRSEQLVYAAPGEAEAGRDWVTRHVYPDGRNRWGERYRGLSFRDFAHELFLADPDGSNLGPTLAIRTGPADFSRKLVTQLQWNGRVNMGGYVRDKSAMSCTCGWQGPDGRCEWRAGFVGKAIIRDPDGRDGGPFAAICPACGQASGLSMLKVSVRTEREYFQICGVPWAEPEDRR